MNLQKLYNWAILVGEIVCASILFILLYEKYSLSTALVIAFELMLAVALLIHNKKYEAQLSLIIIPFILSPVISCWTSSKIILFSIPIIVVLIFLTVFLIRNLYIKKEKIFTPSYRDIYSKKSVLIIVPHQDDDINLMSGVIEEYIKTIVV